MDTQGHGELLYGEPLRSFMEFAESLREGSASGHLSSANSRLLDCALKLEAYLGTPLLERKGKKYSLSSSGSLLLECARKMHPQHGGTKKLVRSACSVRQRKFLTSQTDEAANRLVANTMDFIANLVQADSSLFFWIGPDGEMIDLQSKGANLEFLEFYQKDIGRDDPLHITKLCAGSQNIASLSYSRRAGLEVPHRYARYLVQIDVGDEVALVFWKQGKPIACMTFCRRVQGPLFSLDEVDWTALHSHAQDFLSMHWRFRSEHIESVLVEAFHLTPRELDVVEWLINGKSNWDIAQILDISESTVKVHAASVLKKLGAESRAAVPALVSGL